MKTVENNGKTGLLVCLDMTYVDELLINYLQFYVHSFPDNYEIVLYHNIRFDFPDQADSIVESLNTPLSEVLEKRVKKLVKDRFTSYKTRIVIEEKDNTADALNAFVKNDKGINTVFFGKKMSYEGSGYLIERLIHKDPHVNIVVVPESSGHFLSRIMIPIDFSTLAGETARRGIMMADQLKSDIYFQHVYTIPGIYFPYIPVEDLERQVVQKSEKAWEKFKQKYLEGRDTPIDLSFDAEKSIPQQIYDSALRERINLIVIPYEAKFLNNIAVQLLKKNIHMPIMMLSVKT